MKPIRQFLRDASIAASMLLASFTLAGAPVIPDDCRTGGLAIGCQAYTFNRFTVFEAIEKAAQAGRQGHRVSSRPAAEPGAAGRDLEPNASDEVIQKVKDQLARYKLRAVNYGVVGGRLQTGVRHSSGTGRRLDDRHAGTDAGQ